MLRHPVSPHADVWIQERCLFRLGLILTGLPGAAVLVAVLAVAVIVGMKTILFLKGPPCRGSWLNVAAVHWHLRMLGFRGFSKEVNKCPTRRQPC